MGTPKVIIGALRQYRRTHSDETLPGFDYHETCMVVSKLENRIRDAMEVYAGMEGCNLQTSTELYQDRIIKQMFNALKD